MEKTKTYYGLKLDTSVWTNLGFDDEYFLNRAILDLQTQNIDTYIPGMQIRELRKLVEQEEAVMILTKTSTYPSFFYFCCQ